MKNNNGYLIISLDFELLWGVFDVIDYSSKKRYFINTRQVIPEILKSFEDKGIHSTWATVGMLFNENWDEWKSNIPESIPAYHNRALSAYDFGMNHYNDGIEELCFAPELVRHISEIPGQEIGTHTYSHYYCMEPGQDLENFRADISKAVSLASKFNIQLKSLVFPRNQISEDYLEICRDLGIVNVRSNPYSWYWEDVRSDSIVTRLGRTGDAYIPLGEKTYRLNELKDKKPIEQMASRFLRPSEETDLLRRLKLNRVKREMETAAKKNKIYHLWWHPHNFGDHPERSMRDLNEILSHFVSLHKDYNFQSLNMAELGDMILK
ncbi:polysaccharide deacetylase family protein [Gramella jeungdoensis]|uniref:Polysaccharide deacetylase family protein n=1 Tax=Gramella jeungdoensis TaxID=708091 RepID=A0ABT0Z4Z8_9FLAO|nr:polysaccharide deacetylase family protein [Gramella jeungdoensis]MCM8570478.1 polysaccharide deacetylase family protein [Gramella jeungdoensis]